MLYIFDLGNVVIDIDFGRVLGVWSHLSGVPLASLKKKFEMGEVFEQHERGEISDEVFAAKFCAELGITLSFEQFTTGWQAVFISVRPDVIEIMQKLRAQGNRVIILSNTNRLHCDYWPNQYPEVPQSVDKMYLSQEIRMRKPDPAIYRYVLEQEGVDVADALFFDDNAQNIAAAQSIGLPAVHVTDSRVIPAYFA
ncbi:glucose-1-phosphatase [Acerihabitans sp. TG2]|uniref:glucose-1-phosphatase n=1 Tax=Acerihabitans sp. TG2 TaxID=3096008 RepID=UPI002B23BE0A|nr:glucose-1-phosphatase [Acerihabitans sp. TG2]MEA9392389.1 glucose-1-phosphatase [Acerihabitans sp. TG2]